MKKQIIIAGLSILLIFSSSCNDWLDLRPEDDIVLDDFWKTKSDVEGVLAACYKSLTYRSCIERMMVWGELRSDNIVRGRSFPGGKDIYDMNKILYGNLNSDNKYALWSSFYEVINNCNILLHYAPGVLEQDNNFTQRDLDYVRGEALTIRALAYFYLVRAFKEVPWIEDASIENTQDYAVPKSTEDFVLEKIIEDLNYVKSNGFIRDSYGVTAYDKGRFTKSGLNALLADIYLWKQDYEKCISACDEILGNRNLKLVTGINLIYTELFYKGNATESIFELQFRENDLRNEAVEEMYGKQGEIMGHYAFPPALVYIERLNRVGNYSPFNYKLPDGTYEGASDERAAYSYVDILDGGDIFAIFKYAGMRYGKNINGYVVSYTYRSSTPNWIVYRLSDIMLLKAEALVQLGGDSNWDEALALVNTVYLRSNPTAAPLEMKNYTSKVAIENLVLRERQRELLFEGKRWFDLVRLARRENSVGKLNSYVTIKMQNATAPLGAVTMDAMYMPVAERELQVNKNLKQNPFYDESVLSQQ